MFPGATEEELQAIRDAIDTLAAAVVDYGCHDDAEQREWWWGKMREVLESRVKAHRELDG